MIDSRFVAPLLCALGLTLGGCASLSSTATTPTDSNAATAAPATAQRDVQGEYANIWDRIRAGYGMKALDHPYVAQQEQWFVNNPKYLARVTQRAKLYLYYIVEEIEKRDMPMEIALLPVVESAFKPHAYSRARASGLWQFIPSTGRHYGLQQNWWYDGRRDVIAATNAALNYLQKLAKDFDGDWHLALAAYNAGERRVMREQRRNRKRGLPDRYQNLTRLKPETRNYVPKLLAVANIVADPEKYGVTLAPIANEAYFTQVDIGSQIDLGVLAERADMDISDLYNINPGFKRWATAPKGPFHLLVPTDKEAKVVAALAELPEDKRVQWTRHRIRRGETLSHISERYGVGVRAIKSSNRLRGNRIHAGHHLMIPLSNRSLSSHVAKVNHTPKRAKTRQRKVVAAPSNHVAVVHKVKAGDTLWSIALKYDVYISEITRWNLINRRSVLKLGQKIKIFVKPGQLPSAS